MATTTAECWRLDEIEARVCDIAATVLLLDRAKVTPADRLIEDLNIDSLDLVDLFHRIENAFEITLPTRPPCPIYKAVFTRQPFRLADLAEMVYLQRGTGRPARGWRGHPRTTPGPVPLPFSQLDGRWSGPHAGDDTLYDRLPAAGPATQFRRRSDGMRCVQLPAATVEIGRDSAAGPADERPGHVVEIDAFLIDAEPVATTAYCRFLNSIDGAAPDDLAAWFVLGPGDDRAEHMPIEPVGSAWRPRPGTERWPMVLVSWFGANAYALWANGKDWRRYRAAGDAAADEGLLPTEAQWEYAARGPLYREYPWGDEPPAAERMRYDQHRQGANYRVETLPMADVNVGLGMSPFGLHHMAGNVWQWCRDWYDAGFYARPEATLSNAWNRVPSGVRSERGGSWVGPAELCRSSFRRGRAPLARGRCLGFRCVGPAGPAPLNPGAAWCVRPSLFGW